MKLEVGLCSVRSWRRGDAESLVRHADNRKVWLNLRDGFPHPYTALDAEEFLNRVIEEKPETSFAIDVAGAAVGGVGIRLGTDVERRSAEMGYWLGEDFWGRGITTAAVRALTEHAIEAHALTRVFATPFEGNGASCRVLQKAGYAFEGTMRRSVIKDGRVLDKLLFAYVP